MERLKCDCDVIIDLLTIFGPAVLFIVIGLLTSCGMVKEVPVQTIERIEYRDSLIYITDTVKVEIPYQVADKIIPAVDTSYICTDLAESTAYLDTSKWELHHTLQQKGQVEIQYDTVIKVEYIDRIIEKEIPITVEVTKEVVPNWSWWSLGILIMIIIILITKRMYS